MRSRSDSAWFTRALQEDCDAISGVLLPHEPERRSLIISLNRVFSMKIDGNCEGLSMQGSIPRNARPATALEPGVEQSREYFEAVRNVVRFQQ